MEDCKKTNLEPKKRNDHISADVLSKKLESVLRELESIKTNIANLEKKMIAADNGHAIRLHQIDEYMRKPWYKR